MDAAAEIREFLTTRRARLTPAQAGLPDYGGRRRVPGLRREEVALLAGMSVEYYVRFERGNALGVSVEILDGIARALQLDAAERRHLDDLVRAATEGARSSRSRAPAHEQRVGPGVQRLLDAMTGVPALVQNGRMDVVAINALGRALFTGLDARPGRPANFARFLFLDLRARDFYRDWDDSARQIVSLLRAESGRSPRDGVLVALIEELRAGSVEFGGLWAQHDVDEHGTGAKRLRHAEVGDLDLGYEALQLTGDPGLLLLGWTAEPGSASDDALRLLGSLTATSASAHR